MSRAIHRPVPCRPRRAPRGRHRSNRVRAGRSRSTSGFPPREDLAGNAVSPGRPSTLRESSIAATTDSAPPANAASRPARTGLRSSSSSITRCGKVAATVGGNRPVLGQHDRRHRADIRWSRQPRSASIWSWIVDQVCHLGLTDRLRLVPRARLSSPSASSGVTPSRLSRSIRLSRPVIRPVGLPRIW